MKRTVADLAAGTASTTDDTATELSDIATAVDAGQVRGVAKGREFIAMVTAMIACGAMGVDLMLPAFPEIRRQFGMAPDSTQVRWIVTAYFLGMAVGPLLYGPVSDRYGRRRPLFAGIALYMTGALLATFAPSWGWLVAARFVWGLGAAGPRSLSTALIRDVYEGDAMARMMSMIMAVFLLVPILAPSVGAGLISVLPWRAVFWFPAVMAGLLMIWARRLPETLPVERRRPFTFSAVGQATREVLSNRQTVCFTLAVMFLFSVMSTYLSSSEVIVDSIYGLKVWFPLFFGLIAVLLAISSLNNARLVQRLGLTRLVRRMAIVGVSTSVVLVVVGHLFSGRPPFWLFCVAIALVMPVVQGLLPSCNTAAMTPLPHVAGTASALIATVTTAGGALLGGIASDAFDGTLRPFSIFIAAFVTIAAALIMFGATSRPERAERAATHG